MEAYPTTQPGSETTYLYNNHIAAAGGVGHFQLQTKTNSEDAFPKTNSPPKTLMDDGLPSSGPAGSDGAFEGTPIPSSKRPLSWKV